MTELVLTTFDWVPELPRGYVRDLRIRWALEEAQLPYRVESVSFTQRNSNHFAHQPFGQVPWLTDGELSIFESGAILLHIAEQSETLLPIEKQERSDVIQWLFAALNSMEMAALPYSIFKFTQDEEQTPGRRALDNFLSNRLEHLQVFLNKRIWLTPKFSVADILMADVLRLVKRFDDLSLYPACQEYLERATSRKAFQKAYNDQMEHFDKADQKKAP